MIWARTRAAAPSAPPTTALTPAAVGCSIGTRSTRGGGAACMAADRVRPHHRREGRFFQKGAWGVRKREPNVAKAKQNISTSGALNFSRDFAGVNEELDEGCPAHGS